MANPRAGDVPALLRDLGVPISVGTTTVQGLVDRRDIPVLGTDGMAAFTSRHVVVTIQTGSLPAIAVGGSITVDGASLLVAALHAIEDGELTEVVCAE